MGGGIAQLAAMKGLDVILCDMHKAALERSIATTNRSLSKLVQKQQLTQEQADSASSRIRRGTDMQVQYLQAFACCLSPSGQCCNILHLGPVLECRAFTAH